MLPILLHLVDGVSNANDVSLIAGDGESLLVAWDEPGRDGRRTRLVRAYVCTAGETPAAPPRSIVERETWPAAVDEAARRLIHTLTEEAKSRLRATSQDGLIEYHHDLGMHIRNTFGLWRGNRKLWSPAVEGRRSIRMTVR